MVKKVAIKAIYALDLVCNKSMLDGHRQALDGTAVNFAKAHTICWKLFDFHIFNPKFIDYFDL